MLRRSTSRWSFDRGLGSPDLHPTSVYLADPDHGIAAAVQQRYGDLDCVLVHCTTAQALLAAVDAERALCIVVDAALPDMPILEVLARLQALRIHAPVLCLAEECGVSTAVALMRAGAYDCVERSGPARRVLERLNAFIEEAVERAA
jgi:DNA-binding NtrC family response regulator